MKLICTSEIFFENLISSNLFQIEREKTVRLLINNINMKKNCVEKFPEGVF